MTHKPTSPHSWTKPPAAPTEALERPARLKAWSADLVKIIEKQENNLFPDWTFAPGSLTKADFCRILKKITGCGSVVELRSKLCRVTGELGAPVVHAANFCGQHTVCPYCAGRVQDRRGARFKTPIEAMARTYPHAYLITATVPPSESWREQLGKLIEGWQAFRKMGQIRRRKKKDGTITETRSGGEWGKIRAGLAKIELKRGAGSALPHCHYHALVFTSEKLDFKIFRSKAIKDAFYAGQPFTASGEAAEPIAYLQLGDKRIPASKLTTEWNKATDGAAINFHVAKIGYLDKHKAAGLSYEESVFQQSAEVLKYATKFDSHPETGAEKLFARDFVDIRDATYGRRLFSAYGDFRGVGGDDFKGGGPHISECPQIWETRWRQGKYSDLMPREKPIFENSDASPAVTERLTALNRLQGGTRRIRSAIIKAKNDFFQNGRLAPAVYLKRVYLDDGGFTEKEIVLELPGSVLAAPGDPSSWEHWVDGVTDRGRFAYSALRETLHLESEERICGTKEERQAQDLRVWLLTIKADKADISYSQRVTNAFLEILLAPGMILGPP